MKKAKELGLNLSKVSENALKEAIRRLGGSEATKDCPDGANCTENAGWWTGGDLNPGLSECKSDVPWPTIILVAYQTELPAHLCVKGECPKFKFSSYELLAYDIYGVAGLLMIL